MPEAQPQPSPAPAAQPAAPAAPAPTGLDKVYADYGIEADAQQFHPATQSSQPAAAPAPQPAPAAPHVPDPFSPEFAAYQASLSQGMTALSQAMHQTRGELTSLQRQASQERVEADIRRAVGAIAEKSGLDPEIAEVALEAKARRDPRFLAIWNNRAKNPKAFEAALDAVSGEFKERFSVKQDPQLLENQRAVATSRQSMATTQRTSDADEWSQMTAAERQRKVQTMLRHGGR